MKTVILCGGMGTRLGEHGTNVPKGLVPIGDDPILAHLMRGYAAAGLTDFILCLGFLGHAIREHFTAHPIHGCTLHFADTGLHSSTGERLRQVQPLLADDEDFCLTYGDGLADVDLQGLVMFHRAHGRIATLTAVHPHSSFGMLTVNGESAVTAFREKPRLTEWANGGFFVFDRRIFRYLTDECTLEQEPLTRLAAENELMAYQHDGFWKCMDTYKDHLEFNQLWADGLAPWRTGSR